MEFWHFIFLYCSKVLTTILHILRCECEGFVWMIDNRNFKSNIATRCLFEVDINFKSKTGVAPKGAVHILCQPILGVFTLPISPCQQSWAFGLPPPPQGWAGMAFGLWERELLNPFPNFGNRNGNEKLHSQLLGMGMTNSIPNFWEREREREWQIPFPIFGNGNDKFHSQLSGTGMRRCYSREWSGTGTGMASKNRIKFYSLS